MKIIQLVIAFGLLYLISCNLDDNRKELLNQIFISLPIDTLIENENLYFGLFDTVFYEHKSFEINADEYIISSMLEESIDEGKTNHIIRLDARYSKSKSIIAQNQYLDFINNFQFESIRIEDYKSHTKTGLIIGKAFYKEKNDYSPYILISLLKDSTENNIVSFTYCKNIK
jgi:hypothetical protein